jgi:hypothetical protein
MPENTLLFEVQKLKDVSARLDYFAEQHPVVSEKLLAISTHVRNSAVLLEVLVTSRMSTTIEIAIGRENS